MSAFSQHNLANVISESQRRANAAAVLFNAALETGRQRAFWAGLLRRPNRLLRLEGRGLGGYYAGLREVELDRIRGSEGRTTEFDNHFYPVTTAVRQRWQRVASALIEDLPLPPVELIRVGADYYVRDGHHRISVHRALGLATIVAEVTVWGSADRV